MRRCGLLTGVVFLMVLPAGWLPAQGPDPTLMFQVPTATPPDQPLPPTVCEPVYSASPLALYAPGMFGDLMMILPERSPAGGIGASAPVAFLSSFKIAENETPRPLDRVFITGNFYNDAARAFRRSGDPVANVYREMIGFEKTFLQGDASVGVRLPYFQLSGDPRLTETHLGDLSVLFKFAFVNDRTTGDLLAGGLVVTAPTGPRLPLAGQSTVNPAWFQPWVGGIWNWRDLFVQNFIAVAVPTDARDVTLFFKSVSAGYWLYRSDDPACVLSAIVPDAELHLNSPLNHRGLDHLPIGSPDTLDFTGGCYFFFRKALLGVGVGVPLTGPKPYDFQVSTNLNYRF
jgi:hypothetical protein